MALLQISEPGQSAAPHEHRYAIGVDLGTTHSLVAVVRHGAAQVLPDEQGRVLLPSVVRFMADGEVAVGYDAAAHQAKDPRNTIASAKRFMGRAVREVAHVEHLPYDFVDAPGMAQLRTVAGVRSPVEVSAEILKALHQRARHALFGQNDARSDVVGAVITVPAYFDDAQRQATRDAARLAGLEVLRLLNEPTAAALAYGLDQGAEGHYVVFDLGGGTFDVSVLKLSEGVFEVLATGGDSALGGDDFDHRVYCWVLEQAHLSLLSPEDQRLLMLKARAAKEALSSKTAATVQARLSTGQWVNLTLSREAFAAMTRHLVAKTIESTRRTLRDASLSIAQVQGVVLVGGATRSLAVREAVTEFFAMQPLAGIDPDQVVAVGAALQANRLAGNAGDSHDWLLLDVIALSLGLETMGGLVERIIPRNATIPVARAQEFTTYQDGQTAIAIHVVQGERELVSDCRSLARFELRGIPPMPAGAARVRVTFQVDADGMLSVTARETSSGVEASVSVKPSYGLTDEDITRMLQDSMQCAQTDMHARALRQAQVDARRLLDASQHALAQDGALLSDAQRGAVDAALSDLEAVIEGEDEAAIVTATRALTAATDVLAAHRMDEAIRRALSGRRIDEVQTPRG